MQKKYVFRPSFIQNSEINIDIWVQNFLYINNNAIKGQLSPQNLAVKKNKIFY
jgi:hypothetical protein